MVADAGVADWVLVGDFLQRVVGLVNDKGGAHVHRAVNDQVKDNAIRSTTDSVHVGAEKLVIAGFATNLCVLFTASDAYMRGFDIVVPDD